MASDIYEFEGMFNSRKLAVSACNFKEDFDIHSLREELPDGESVQLLQQSPEDAQIILGKIRSGEIQLTYLGGWCSSGVTWGPDDVRHYPWTDREPEEQ